MKNCIGVNVGKDLSESTQVGDHNLRKLMDFQNIETYFPKLKPPEYESFYSSFLKSKIDETDLLKIVHANGKVILSDCFIVTLKSLITGVRVRDLANFELLVNSAKELFWYLSPHVEKLATRSLYLPATFRPLSKLNKPKRHGHKVPDINQEVLLSLVNAVNSHLEKSYVTRTNFKPVKNVLGNIIEISVKYSDCMTKNKHIQVEYQVNDEEQPQYKKAIFQLPILENLNTYKVKRERNAIVSLKEALKDKNFDEPVSVDIYFLERRSYRYVFICSS